jgi:hypothetical protein
MKTTIRLLSWTIACVLLLFAVGCDEGYLFEPMSEAEKQQFAEDEAKATGRPVHEIKAATEASEAAASTARQKN